MKHLILGLALVCLPLFSQQKVNSEAPALVAYQWIFTYDGSNNLTQSCRAASLQPRAWTGTVSGATNASPAALTLTAHGLSTSSRPSVTISGGTGSWAAINGTWTATPTTANAFTIPVDSTAFGALAGTIVVTSNAPRTSDPIWACEVNVYNGSNIIVWRGWKNGTASESLTSATATQYQ